MGQVKPFPTSLFPPACAPLGHDVRRAEQRFNTAQVIGLGEDIDALEHVVRAHVATYPKGIDSKHER